MKVKYFILPLIMAMFIMVANGASYDFSFKIEIDHDFDEDDEITCDVTYDDTEREWTFGDNSDNDELIFEKNFDNTIELDCNDKIDEITLYIYEDDEKLEKLVYENEDDFEYLINFADKDEDWFEIEIDHDFNGEKIDCELKIDSKYYDYDFDEDTDGDDLTIERNYEDTIEFDCDEKLDEIVFKVYDEEDELYEKIYEEEDSFDYERGDNDVIYEFRIDIDHNFDDSVSCELVVDDNEEFNYDFDENTDSGDLRIVKDFAEKIEFDCNEDLDEITLYIYDDDGEKIDSLDYEDEDKFEYEVREGLYDLFIQVTNSFDLDETIECDLYTDGEKVEDFEFDSSSGISDLRIEDEFNSQVEFVCDENLDEMIFIVFEDEEEDEGDEIYKRVYSNEFSFMYDINNNINEEANTEPVVENISIVSEKINVTLSEEKTLKNESIDNTQQNASIEGSNLQGNENQQAGNLNSSMAELDNDEQIASPSEEVEKSNTFLKWLGIFVLAGLFVFLIGVLMKLDILTPKNAKKTPSKKDIDFSFLKNKNKR